MERASLKERFLALIIDYIILAFTLLVVILAVAGTIFITDVHKAKIILLVLGILFYLKDSAGQSPGKRLFGIKIVRRSDFKKPNIILPFIRNLFLCLGIIEVIVILSDENHERLGDKVTKTIVVKADNF
jgi:uncharacterized RDD family membrane protein YckC